MDRQETNRIIAEKVMEYPIIDCKEPKQAHRPCPCFRDYGTMIALVHNDGGYGDGSENYNPTENVAQAIEAIDLYCARWDKMFILRRNPPELWRVSLGDNEERSVVVVYAATPSLAICEAMVKAVNSEEQNGSS